MALPTQTRQLGQLIPNQILHRQEPRDDTNSQQPHFQQYQSQPQSQVIHSQQVSHSDVSNMGHVTQQ